MSACLWPSDMKGKAIWIIKGDSTLVRPSVSQSVRDAKLEELALRIFLIFKKMSEGSL